MFLARRFEDGLIECRRALAIDPGFALAHWAQSIVLTDLARYDAALDSLDGALTASSDFLPVAACWIYAAAGQRERAEDMLMRVRARTSKDPRFTLVFAWIAMASGEIDEAFA